MVKRLADYKWSSYLAYGYGKSAPQWLFTKLILSQFEPQEEHKQYREKVQKYSKEEKRLREDFVVETSMKKIYTALKFLKNMYKKKKYFIQKMMKQNGIFPIGTIYTVVLFVGF